MSICALSGKSIQVGVVSRKTGHIFEKSAIEKHLTSFPYCPITNQPLRIQDLIEVIPHTLNIQKSDKSALTYINQLIEDYDTLILQTHYLRKGLKQTEDQLLNSIYQNQAAQIVIARLLKQKQEAENQIMKLKEKKPKN